MRLRHPDSSAVGFVRVSRRCEVEWVPQQDRLLWMSDTVHSDVVCAGLCSMLRHLLLSAQLELLRFVAKRERPAFFLSLADGYFPQSLVQGAGRPVQARVLQNSVQSQEVNWTQSMAVTVAFQQLESMFSQPASAVSGSAPPLPAVVSLVIGWNP